MYDKNIPIGIPINNDLEQVIILSKNIIFKILIDTLVIERIGSDKTGYWRILK